MNVTNLFSSLSGLSSVHRYSMTKMTAPESVLEHSGWVAIASMIIAKELNDINRGSIILEDVLTRALIHDVDEIVTGDIPRPTKYRNEDTIEAFKQMSRWGVDKVVGSLGLSPAVSESISRAHRVAKVGREGLVVAIADCMAVVYKLWEEVLVRRNHSMTCHAAPLIVQIENLFDRVAEEFVVGESRAYLYDILDQCKTKAFKVHSMDDPDFGSKMRE